MKRQQMHLACAAAAFISCDDPTPENLFDAYANLLKAEEQGLGDTDAVLHVEVWDLLEDKTVKELISLIQCQADYTIAHLEYEDSDVPYVVRVKRPEKPKLRNFEPPNGFTGHGDICFSDADPGL